MSPAEQMLARLRAARLSWFELAPGLRVQILRPTEVEMITGAGRPALEMACSHVVGWEGFTGAVLEGATVGTDEVLAFDADLWAAYAADHADHTAAVAMQVRDIQSAYWAERKAQAKN